ncbi:murein hydrolase activator EnvC family protein [Neptuniibacter sp.]|uniref:murein hydrolase activator EnvC family protein n=1 Tax=Neptuniibacter sp. TaxID=1962643 RepID=UPI003B592CF2
MLRTLSVFLCLLLVYPSLVEADEKQTLTEKQLKALTSNIASLKKTMQKQEGDSRQLSASLRKSEVAIGRLAKQIKALDSQLKGLDSRAETLEDKRDELRKELSSRAKIIEKQIGQQYQMGQQARLQLLLTQRDPETLDRTIRYYDFVNDALKKDMLVFKEKLADLSGTEEQLSETEKSIVSKRNELQAEVKALKASRTQRKATLAKLNKALSNDSKKLKQLKLDQARLQAVLKEIEKSLNFATLVTEGKSFNELKGKLPWPLKGRVSQNFGTVQNNIRYDGIWIKAAESTQVKAVHHGRVVFSDWLRGYGLVLIVDHGSGYMSLYGYNQSLLMDTGDWVSAGDTIATVGNSGGRNDDGLYFAVRYKGKASNPKRWLK